MIRDPAYWENWEAQTVLRQPADFHRNLRLLEAMYEHACKMGAFAGTDPLDGLEVKLRLAKVLNVPTNSGTTGPRP